MSSTRLPGKLLPRVFFEHPPEQVAPRLLGKLLVRRMEDGSIIAGRIVEVEAYLGPHNDPPDRAAHSHRGPTARNAVLFGPAGHAYLYFIYGMHYCVNISCEAEGQAGSLLIRALEPVVGLEEMARNRGLVGPKTKQRETHPSGAKARVSYEAFSARLKSCPDTKPAPALSGRLKSCPDTRSRSAPWRLTSGPSRLCQALALRRAEHNGADLLAPRSPLQVRDDGFEVAEYCVTPRIGITHAAERPLRFALPGHACVSGPKSLVGERVSIR